MNRNQNGIDRPLPDDAHRFRNAVPVQHGKAAAAGGIHPRPLDR
jgi:hypothetical protein